MEFRAGTPLRPDQTARSVLWTATLDELGFGEIVLPQLRPRWFWALWGDTKEGRRLKTFGHAAPGDIKSPHFVATRGGTPMHTDPAYIRYALQLQLHNDGWLVHGLAGAHELPVMAPGRVILLDTHSPHKVSRDPRLPQLGPNKLLVGMDFDRPPEPLAALPALLAHLARGVPGWAVSSWGVV